MNVKEIKTALYGTIISSLENSYICSNFTAVSAHVLTNLTSYNFSLTWRAPNSTLVLFHSLANTTETSPSPKRGRPSCAEETENRQKTGQFKSCMDDQNG